MTKQTRRAFLGSASLVTTVGLAGCAGSDGGGTTTISGESYPAINRWLTETDVGDATDNYDGTLADRTGQGTVTVSVGSEGNGGAFAYDPPAVLVSTGTSIEWSWTGDGGDHNVEAEPDDQIGESDFEFSSGEATTATGVQYTRSMDEVGVALYHCEPHLSLGMKGAIAVEESE
jgi:halocyanin-like protein